MCSDWSITWIYNVYKWLFILVLEGMWPLGEFHNGFCCQRAQRCRDFTLIIIWWSWWKKWGQYTGLATFGWGFRQWVQPYHCQEDSQPLTPLLTSQSLTHNRLCTCSTMLLQNVVYQSNRDSYTLRSSLWQHKVLCVLCMECWSGWTFICWNLHIK